MIKKKLRDLRKKRENERHRKGGFSKSCTSGKFSRIHCIVKRKGGKSALYRRIVKRGKKIKKPLNFGCLFALTEQLNKYLQFNVKAKAKKRGGKNK